MKQQQRLLQKCETMAVSVSRAKNGGNWGYSRSSERTVSRARGWQCTEGAGGGWAV